MQKNLSQAFWFQTRQTASLSQVRDWKNLQLKNNNFHAFLNHLKTDLSIIMDHFYAVFLEKQGFSKPTTEEMHLKVNQQISELFNALRKDKPEEIQEFIEGQSLTKADKILALFYIIHYGALSEKIFDLMDGLSLSVNDSLTFKDIKSSLIPNELNTEDIVLILSHHLLSTKKIKIIEKLMERDLDFSQKSAMGDNIINSYLLLNWAPTKKESKKLAQGLITFLYNESFYRLLTDKNLLGLAPVSFAFSHPSKIIRKILLTELKTLQIPPLAVMAKDYTNLWNYLMEEKTKDSSVASVTYFDFQSFFQNLFNFFDPYQKQRFRNIMLGFFNQLQHNFMEAEQVRFLLLDEFISEEKEEYKNTRLILKAIFNRDEDFFKNLDSREDIKTEELFINLTYKNQGSLYLLSNPLSEAIRHSFPPAVEYLLKKFNQSKKAQKIEKQNREMLSYSLDPLSLALVAYGSLAPNDSLKPPAKEILKLLYDNWTEIERYNFPLSFAPIDWALFFGLKEEVQFLHETKGLKLTKNTLLSIDGNQWVLMGLLCQPAKL